MLRPNCRVDFFVFTKCNYCCEMFGRFCVSTARKMSEKITSDTKTDITNPGKRKAVIFDMKLDTIKT